MIVWLPIAIPLTFALIAFGSYRSRRLQRAAAIAGTVIQLLAAAALLSAVWDGNIRAVQVGGWPSPFGVTLVADLLSAVMVVLASVVGTVVTFFSLAFTDPTTESRSYFPLVLLLLMAVSGAFLTGDIFNLYVWFEVTLIVSFVLLALEGGRAQMEGAIKYVTLNLISSAAFLAAVGILYGLAGTVNLADLGSKLNPTDPDGSVTVVAMLFLVAFGIKAAIFPFFFWLPASYHVPSPAVSALFAGVLTKVGLYALIRVFTLVFRQDVAYTHLVILVLAGVTMVTGVLGAVAQDRFPRILAFHSVSQVGYIVMGLGLFNTLALAGSIYFIIHHSLVKSNLFLISGLTGRQFGSGELKKLGGMYRSDPMPTALFAVTALSLAGLPPFSGFVAKLTLATAGVRDSQYLIVAFSLLVGLLTLYSMTKIWNEVFWKPLPEDPGEKQKGYAIGGTPVSAYMWIPVGALALIAIAVGLGAGSLLDLLNRAGEQLMAPERYIEAVLGSAV